MQVLNFAARVCSFKILNSVHYNVMLKVHIII